MELQIAREPKAIPTYKTGDIVEIKWEGTVTPIAYLIAKSPTSSRLHLIRVSNGVTYCFLQMQGATVLDLINDMRSDSTVEEFTIYSQEEWKLKMEKKGGDHK
ncbi:hypothetical protein BK703_16550 [Bacillus thuringiensis serovar silo]|uniref:hypothetical protein n=1 Tax=Bacillus thuringiensis TaxID=1428 RepID=UPI000A3625F1|nr:hypothetical protein [Bacillus thuringiensis]MDA2128681.1 hypothetical protein [Bacillus cereus]MED3275375.1 hypothetical protein [Bacillus thuringiensis]OTW55250.1 hypothetical protein BK703_16550 [Bacillus thuringiensis serovar silo]OTW74318.1 hypothetical protein BK700_01495 [Bacillus thuringiensis serovar toguchini]